MGGAGANALPAQPLLVKKYQNTAIQNTERQSGPQWLKFAFWEEN